MISKPINSIGVCLIILLAIALPIKSQVTIGSSKSPSSAALLEVKSQEPSVSTNVTDNTNITSTKGGVLLPRVKLVSLTTLEPFMSLTAQTPKEKMLHAGLMVYNINATAPFEKDLYVWDGAKWIVYNPNFIAKNGITLNSERVFVLGGKLTKNTTINQNGHSLTIDTKTDALRVNPTTGNFSVAGNTLVVGENNLVGVGTNTPSVNLDIQTEGTSTTPIPGFRLTDGTEGLGKTLTSSEHGVGTWTINPPPIYGEIPYVETAVMSLSTLSNGIYLVEVNNQPWMHEFDAYGVYSMNLMCQIIVNNAPTNLNTFKVTAFAVRLIPKPDINYYTAQDEGDAFRGASEYPATRIYYVPPTYNHPRKHNMCLNLRQNIRVAKNTGKKMYMAFYIRTEGNPGASATIQFKFGTGTGATADVGGSFVKVN